MTEPEWLDLQIILDFHSEQLAIFGGGDGIRDHGLLESAIARPLNKWGYGEEDLAVLAAAYGYGIASNHPFIDGNKRTAYTALLVFLRMNGVRFAPTSAQATAAMLAVASGELTEDGLIRWIRDNWPAS